MNEIIFIVDKDMEGGFNTHALGYSIFTQGDDMATLKANIKEAIKCHFDKDGDVPRIIRLHMVTEEVFAYA
jgi:hypothetical protein